MSTHFSDTHFLKPPSAKFLRTRCSSFSSHARHQTTIGCFFSTSFFTTWCNFTGANSGRIHVSICRRIYFKFSFSCSFSFCTKFCHYFLPFIAIAIIDGFFFFLSFFLPLNIAKSFPVILPSPSLSNFACPPDKKFFLVCVLYLLFDILFPLN